MDIRQGQQVLAAVRAYLGAIDGDAGPQTRAAVKTILDTARIGALWSADRRFVAAVQVVLDLLGHDPGAVDGLFGHNTREALTDFLTVKAQGAIVPVPRVPAVGAAEAKSAQADWPRQAEVEKFFGPAGSPAATAGKVELPFPFYIAWDLDTRVSRFSAHAKVAPALTLIFAEAAKHYGRDRFEALGLSLFGGCYNFRKMRGGSSLSMHSYGIAVDLDPERNQLRWGRDRASFARSEYLPFWAIVEAHGATSLGRAANMDWMHFQFARL